MCPVKNYSEKIYFRDMIEIGQLDDSWLGRLPESLCGRLQELLDDPEG